jgi:hypothetical protein
MKTSVIAAALLGLTTSLVVNAQQPPPLQLNVPYHCANNTIVVVKHCEMRGGTEVCSLVKGPANGPLGDEISMPKAQAAAIGLICTLQGGTPSQTGRTATTAPGGRTFNPPYLSEMPPVDRVLAAMKTNDPRETAVRQIWAFYELNEIIKALSGNREFARTGMLPDERKIMGDYQMAQYKVSQEADKNFPTNKPSEDLTYHFSRWDASFGFKGINIWQFFSEGLQSQFAQIVGKDNARYAALRAEQKRIAAQGVSADPHPTAPSSGSPFVRNDPGTLAARRCVELGGDALECVGKGLSTGLFDMAGVSPAAIQGAETSGVFMNGPYQSAAGMSLSFGLTTLSLNGCGKLVPNGHAYTITKRPNQLLINVQSEPASFALTLGNDGKLSGPGPTDVKGQIITGYRNVWMQLYRHGTAVPGGGYWTQVPIYAPKTERCTLGTFAQAPPPAPDKNQLTAAIGSALNTIMPSGPSGLRMSGHYASQSGLALEFAVDSVVLDCGAAHVKQTYTVENAPNQILVTVKNGSSPFTLAVQTNGTLAGCGATEIAGRVVTGSTENALTYAAQNARCAIGTLTPAGGTAAAQVVQ